jgi:hypothetical protein
MAQGQAKVKYVGSNADVMYRSATLWDYIYSTSTVKDPNYEIGDRVVLPDGREYRYSKSASAITGAMGCKFSLTGHQAYTAFGAAHVAGVTAITVPAGTHAALTKDELRGGMVIIFDATGGGTCTRGILGNDVSLADVAYTLYLDGPTHIAITTSDAIEVFANPWSALVNSTDVVLPVAGVPATAVAATATYFWCQTKGLTFINPQAAVGTTNGGVGVNWRHDGSLEDVETALAVTVAENDSTQYAGYCVAGSASGNGPLFNLQG